MVAFNIVVGVVTLVSFGVALWQSFRNAKNKIAESSKAEVQLERLRQAQQSALSAAQTVNLVVQRAKDENVTLEEVRSLGRVARGQILVVANQLEQDADRLADWEYGKLFDSHASSEKPTQLPDQG